ncbi:hypothetical protein M8818_006745 [Zalaria obscura]|uniref:Uncharacterized protein n=1 Tax=Zalaria obscura TaxID=2024903 RepID=A0ACC3S969_9PEZI
MVASTAPQSAQSRVTPQEGVATDSQHRPMAPGESTGTLRVPQPRQDDSSSSSDSDDNAQHNFGDPTNAEPGGLLDTNVESIITKIQQVKFGEDVPLGHTRRVPKGFNLRAVIDHANYEAGTKLLKERERQRKALGLPVTTSRRRRLKHGFDPKQVIRKHALSAANGYPHQYNTLTNDIHPLLDHERFVDCPLEVYDVLKPALRLASVWLLHRATSTYWQTLAWGTRTVCKELFAPGGAPIERIRDDVSWSSGARCLWTSTAPTAAL